MGNNDWHTISGNNLEASCSRIHSSLRTLSMSNEDSPEPRSVVAKVKNRDETPEMSPSTASGWYPNPDGSPNQRRWDGKEWTTETRPYPSPNSVVDVNHKLRGEAPLSSKGRRLEFVNRISRPGWIMILSGLVIVTLATVLPTISAGRNNENSSGQNQIEVTKSTSQPKPEAKKPTPAGPVLIPLGSPIVSPNFSLVIDSVEVLDQIETNYDGPIVADPGTRLVLVHSTISVTGSAIDLTCAVLQRYSFKPTTPINQRWHRFLRDLAFRGIRNAITRRLLVKP